MFLLLTRTRATSLIWLALLIRFTALLRPSELLDILETPAELTPYSVVNIFMLLIAIPLVERLGRRTMLLSFSPIAIGSLLVMGGVLRTDSPAVGPVLIAFA